MRQSSETLGEPERGRKDRRVEGKESPLTVFLDPYLTAKGDPLVALVEDLMPLIKPSLSGRIRSLRRDAAQRKHLCVSNIAANLAFLALSPNREPGNLLAVSTAKTKPTRYDREDYPRRILAETLEALEGAGVLTRHPYVFKQRNTTVEPTSGFTEMLQHHGVRLRDIGRDAGGESLRLLARTAEPRFGNQPPPKCLVHYADTEETIRLRGEVDRVSAFLNEAGISYEGEPCGPVWMNRAFLLRAPDEAASFDLNGRLWGGFWQGLKSHRRHLITIGGEGIADLDFVSLFAMLAYRKATGELPSGDPYEVPGLEGHRKGAKQGLLSLLSRRSRMKLLAPDLKALLPEGWTAKRLVEAMSRRHPAIAHLFGSDIGVDLMNTESRIVMAVLRELETKGIPVLPIHDGINARLSDRAAALEAMEAASERLLGVALPVKEKPVWRPEAMDEAA